MIHFFFVNYKFYVGDPHFVFDLAFFRSLLLDPTIDIWLNIWHTTRQSCEEQSDIHKWSSDSSMVICRPDCLQSQEKLDQEVQFQEGTGKGDCQAYLIFEFFLHNRNLKPRNLTLEDGWMTNINRCAAKHLLQQLLGDIARTCPVSILYVFCIIFTG